MNPLKITSTQSTAATPADPSSTASDSDSDFGPILKAASVRPAAAPTQGQSRSGGSNQADGDSKDERDAAATPDSGSAARSDRTAPRGRARTDSVSQDAAAAAAAACAAAAGVTARTDTAPCEGATATGNASKGANTPVADASAIASDPGRAGSSIANARAVVAPDAASAPEAAIASAVTGALPAQSAANPPTPIDSRRAVTAQAPRADGGALAVDRMNASQTASAAAQSKDARSTDTSDDASDDRSDADSQGDPGFAALLSGTGPSAQAPLHTLSAQIQQAVATVGGNPPSHSSSSSTPLLPNDPSSNLAGTAPASAAGAFGNVTAYAAEGRTAAVTTPVGQPGFGQELSERVVVLAQGGVQGGVQTAQISLEPAGLGPVGVSIQVHGHEASLVFTAQHETTRNALEAELPRLREMFAASGMHLSDASVGDRGQPQWSAPNQSSSGQARDGGGADPVAPGLDEASKTARPLAVPRLVDIYA